MEESYRLDTRDRPSLLFAMMHALAAENSRMSLEGSLSASELIQLPGATEKESGALRRATLQPRLLSRQWRRSKRQYDRRFR